MAEFTALNRRTLAMAVFGLVAVGCTGVPPASPDEGSHAPIPTSTVGAASAIPAPSAVATPSNVLTPSAAGAVPPGTIAFMTGEPDGSESYFTSDTDGTNQHALFSTQGCACLAWSPDGTEIWAVGETDHGTVTWMTMDPGGSNVELHESSIPTLSLIPGVATPDGSLIAFNAFDDSAPERNGIWVGSRDLTDLRQVTQLSEGASSIATIPLGITPDGGKIVFFEETGSQGIVTHAGDLYVVDSDGQNLRKLNDDSVHVPMLEGLPATLSPSGDRVAFAGFRQGVQADTSAIYVARLDRGAAEQIIGSEIGIWSAHWAPVGEVITYASFTKISAVNADGSDQRDLSAEDDHVGFGSWSPDGKNLLVSRGADGERDLWIMDLDGTYVAQVTHAPADYVMYAWGPEQAGAPPVASATATPSPSATPRPPCPFEQLGTCLGELPVAGTFASGTFHPPFTFTTPQAGWANWVDERADYLLLPPGEAPQGVDEDTSEFIGLYRGVRAALGDCDGGVKELEESATTMAASIGTIPGLAVTLPEPVTVGGLNGVMIDVSLSSTWTETCNFRPGVPLVPLLIGTGPTTGLNHVIDASYNTRLYLLDIPEDVLTIEVVDHEGRLELTDLDEFVRTFEFDLDATLTAPDCPNIEGGSCLGELDAGTHATVEFDPALTYTVVEGWQNLEDTPGNFLLVPPGFELAGVNDGGSDYIGVYSTVVAASAVCSTPELAERPEPGVGLTPDAIVAEFVNRPGLVVSTPESVSIGGREGLMLDVSMDPAWTTPCFYSGGNPVVPLIQGTGLSGLDHPVGHGVTTRLYLLDNGTGTLLVEISAATEGTPLDEYSDVVTDFLFGP